jgi:hypothetical protein
LVISNRDQQRGQSVANRVLDAVCSWGSTKGLIFNPAKTKCIHMSMGLRSERHAAPLLSMLDSPLHYDDELVYLGVVLNSKNNWSSHLEFVRSRAMKKLMICGRIAGRTWGISRDLRLMLYKTVFLSSLLYASPAWFAQVSNRIGLLNRLRKSQRPALIWITSSYRTCSNASLPILAGVLPIEIECEVRHQSYLAKRDGFSPRISTKTRRQNAWLSWTSNIDTSSLNPILSDILIDNQIPTKIINKFDYWSVQLLTGHISFAAYYCDKIKIINSSNCPLCGAIHTNSHVIFDCDKLADVRVRTKFSLCISDKSIDLISDSNFIFYFNQFAMQALKRCIAAFRALQT